MGTRVIACLGSALVMMLALAATAGADTFCVNRSGCSDPGHNFTTIQQAINAAEANNPASPPASPDLILVGDGVFHEAVTEGGDNPVDIVGSGPRTESGGTLIERDPGNSVRTVLLGVALGGRASTIKDVTIQVPSGADNSGLVNAGEADNVVITAATSPSPPTNSVGIYVNGNGQTPIRNAKVDLPGTSIGVLMHLADLESSSVKASTGLEGDGTIHGSTIDANLGAQSSELKLEDCVMHISGPNGVALSAVGIGFNVFSRIKARHLTVIGDSDPTSLAVLAEAEGSTSDNSAEVDIRSSILRGFAMNFKRRADNGSGGKTGTANLTVAYSDYDKSLPEEDSGDGPGTLDDTTGNISANPGFRSANDLHLSPGSPLIDGGDPASPDTSGFPPDSTVDFDGLPRRVDGNGDGIARADIGAFEFRPEPPHQMPILDTTGPRITLKGKRVQTGAKLVKVKVTSDEAAQLQGGGKVTIPAVKAADSAAGATKKSFKLQAQTKPIAAGETMTLTLRLTKRAKQLTKQAQAKGKMAKVTITVSATDAAGNQGSAKLKVKLKRKKS